ncbi:DUF1192 domain-containing protein [Kordiimonas sp. SCSIO 12610]|uniref:DUF1192 domain-containing protein n=1 Tax=Kordiimonas sp. SCSIO 12610 TaxID=2829597 RepID=UPI00210CC24F|nr:DUF1192 domain-containing protein [Kordiimonas sp. SCSIO 12610]UTW55803.1 DUF1192 domain-containing protein [Kordiimonas sp. SCSIO 12610]
MDEDDLPIKKDSPVASVVKEDLSTWSAFELEARVNILKEEIIRTEAEIKSKDASRAAAEAFFKS